MNKWQSCNNCSQWGCCPINTVYREVISVQISYKKWLRNGHTLRTNHKCHYCLLSHVDNILFFSFKKELYFLTRFTKSGHLNKGHRGTLTKISSDLFLFLCLPMINSRWLEFYMGLLVNTNCLKGINLKKIPATESNEKSYVGNWVVAWHYNNPMSKVFIINLCNISYI